MSRIGKAIITIPAGVKVNVNGQNIKVEGPKGKLETTVHELISINLDGDKLSFTRPNDEKFTRAMHGTTNANITNMIKGVTEGFSKGLEIIGVGYRFTVKGTTLVINAGYSHPVELAIPTGLTVEAPSNTEITVNGIDKVLVGKFAAEIRDVRSPEPYKGKGIRYKDEHVRRKEGKKAA